MNDNDNVKTKTLYKALKVLDCFTSTTPELGIVEISEQLGLYKSNVHNIVDTFVKAGYLVKNPDNGKFRLAMKVLQLGNAITSNISFRKVLLPHMQQLADETGETVYLGVPSEEEVIYLDSSSPRSQVLTKSVMGIKAPLYCTGIGKAMLAHLPDTFLESVLAKGLRQFTDHTITQRETLLQELELTRKRGYAIDNMEHQFGIKCVAIPVRSHQGEVIAGLSVSGPSPRFDDTRIVGLAGKLAHLVASVEVG